MMWKETSHESPMEQQKQPSITTNKTTTSGDSNRSRSSTAAPVRERELDHILVNNNVQTTSRTKESSHSTSFSYHPPSNVFSTNNDSSSTATNMGDYQQRDHGYKMNVHDPINYQQMMSMSSSSSNSTLIDPRSAGLHNRSLLFSRRASTGNSQQLPDGGVHELGGEQHYDYNALRPCTEGSSSSSGHPGVSDQDGRVSTTDINGDAPREAVGQNHHQSQNIVVWNAFNPTTCGGSAYAGTRTPRFFLPPSSFSHQQPAFLTRLYPEFHSAKNATGSTQAFLESASSLSYTKHLQGGNVPVEEQDENDKLDSDFRSIGKRQSDDLLLLPPSVQSKKRRVGTISGITTSQAADLHNKGTTPNNSSIVSAVNPPPRLPIPPGGLLFTDGVPGRGTSFGGFTPAAEIMNQEYLNRMLSLSHQTSSMIQPSMLSTSAAAAITNLQEVSGSGVGILGPFFVALPASSNSISSTVSSSTGATTRNDHSTASDVQTRPRNLVYRNTSNSNVATMIPPFHLQNQQESVGDPEERVFVSSSSVSTCTSGGNNHRIRPTGGSSQLGRRTPAVVLSNRNHDVPIRAREDDGDDGILTLKTPSDVIWLSPFLCFLREECCEVFKASGRNVKERRKSKKIKLNQVGIRCRFCSHLPHSERKGRSSCFPSSIDRIYQSVTMMVREHFSTCEEFPPEIRQKYTVLKKQTKRGEMESKTHWQNAAREIGMVDIDSEEDEEEGEGSRKKGIFFKDDL